MAAKRPELAARISGLLFIALHATALCSSAAHAQEASAARSNSTHVVQPGDTLWDLSRRYMNTPIRWPELQRDNAVPIPERMRPGQVLTLGAFATAVEISGEVLLGRAGSWQPLDTGAALEPDDVLSTGRTGFLTLAFGDGSKVVIPSSSAVRLLVAHGRETRLELLNGRVESYVEKQKARDFEIRTRSFALGVKGTHFRVRASPETSTIEVLEGTVVATPLASDHPSVAVASGQGATLADQHELGLRSLLPAPEQRPAQDRNVVAASDVDGAIAYRLQLARDPSFLRLQAESMADAPRFPLSSDLTPGFYHTRLSAFDAQSIEGQSGAGLIFVSRRAAENDNTVRRLADDSYEIRWTPRQGKRHTFELSQDPDFATLLASESGDFPQGVIVGPLQAPLRYFWRCQEEAEAGLPRSAWNGSFEVPAL